MIYKLVQIFFVWILNKKAGDSVLTPKERLYKALRKQEVDRIPCICPGGMMNMIVEDIMDKTGCQWPDAHSDAVLMAKLSAGMYEFGGFENYGVPFCMTVEAEAMGASVIMGSRVNEPRIDKYPISSVAEWRKLKRIEVEDNKRINVTLEAINILKNKNNAVPIVGNLIGPVSLASSLVEPTIFYKEIIKKRELCHEFMEFVTENLIVFGKAQIAAGADVIAISDPSATGEILGPKLFHEYGVRYINKIVKELRPLFKTGLIVHICGRLKSIYDELNELESDAISFDSITSVKEVKGTVNNKSIMGNVSTLALEKNTPEEIKDASRYCIESGANILSPACGIGTRTPLVNVQAMVSACKE